MCSEGYGSWVCPSVSRSLLDGLFIPQTIPPTQQITRISLIEDFFLKRLRYRDQHLPLLYGLLRSAILCAENNVMHVLTGDIAAYLRELTHV